MAELLDRFVCVRAVEMEGVDLSLFQIDYDETWCAFFLNADRTIYGRYGTRASRGADLGVDVSLAGFEKALEGALEVHAGYPGNRRRWRASAGPSPRRRRSAPSPSSRAASPRIRRRAAPTATTSGRRCGACRARPASRCPRT
jgi:hypothetical protein